MNVSTIDGVRYGGRNQSSLSGKERTPEWTQRNLLSAIEHRTGRDDERTKRVAARYMGWVGDIACKEEANVWNDPLLRLG